MLMKLPIGACWDPDPHVAHDTATQATKILRSTLRQSFSDAVDETPVNTQHDFFADVTCANSPDFQQ